MSIEMINIAPHTSVEKFHSSPAVCLFQVEITDLVISRQTRQT